MESHRLEFPTSHNRSSSWLNRKSIGLIFLFFFISVSIALGLLLSVRPNRVVQGVFIDSLPVGELSKSEIHSQLTAVDSPVTLPNTTITVTFQDKTWTASSSGLGVKLNTDAAIDEALLVGRRGNFFQKARERLQARLNGYSIPLPLIYDETALASFVQAVAQDVNIPGKQPNIQIDNKKITIATGEYGQALNTTELTATLQTAIGKAITIEAPVEVTHIPLTPDGSQRTEYRISKLVNVILELQLNENTPKIVLEPATFLTWLELPDGFRKEEMEKQLTTLTQKWNNEPQNAEFVLSDDGKSLEKFVPDRSGQEVDVAALSKSITQKLVELENQTATTAAKQTISFTVPIEEAQADVRLQDTNSLGIKERIGIGTSEFKHSIPNRIFNVDLTAKRIHATLVAPGEEFSFNQSVGDISAKSGYKTAYVIMNGRTQLGDGGGVCQVSTTVFRAALNAGLPITRWKPHSYRVGYYEQNNQPGFDATVFSPSQDFRFRNDTGHHLVVTSYVDTASQFMNVEIWGTSDGRTSEISDYKIWNQRSAPAPLYQEDLSLAPGVTKQVDFAAPGASTKFLYTVKDAQGNELHKKEFVSNFRPWQAIFLVGPNR